MAAPSNTLTSQPTTCTCISSMHRASYRTLLRTMTPSHLEIKVLIPRSQKYFTYCISEVCDRCHSIYIDTVLVWHILIIESMSVSNSYVRDVVNPHFLWPNASPPREVSNLNRKCSRMNLWMRTPSQIRFFSFRLVDSTIRVPSILHIVQATQRESIRNRGLLWRHRRLVWPIKNPPSPGLVSVSSFWLQPSVVSSTATILELLPLFCPFWVKVEAEVAE